MSNAKATATASGVGFVGLLTIAFIVLKLTNVINWSWWWVLSPIWIQAALILSVIIIGIIIILIIGNKKL